MNKERIRTIEGLKSIEEMTYLNNYAGYSSRAIVAISIIIIVGSVSRYRMITGCDVCRCRAMEF